MKTTTQSKSNQKATADLADTHQDRPTAAGEAPGETGKNAKPRTTVCEPAISNKSDDDDDDDD